MPISLNQRMIRYGVGGLAVAGIVVGGWITRDTWLPALDRARLSLTSAPATAPSSTKSSVATGSAKSTGKDTGKETGHDHDHDSDVDHAEPAVANAASTAAGEHPAGAVAATAVGHSGAVIEISQAARETIGLRTAPLALKTYRRSISVPGIVAERPGWTRFRISAPFTGIVTRLHVIAGETLAPGQPLFEIRLMHEDLVQVQVDFLRQMEELDVVEREIARLTPVYEEGALPKKLILDRTYEKQKLEAGIRSVQQAMLLHGLPQDQIDEITKTRKLKSEMTVYAPPFPKLQSATAGHPAPDHSLAETAATTGALANAGASAQLSTSTPAGTPPSGPEFYSTEDVRIEPGRMVNTGETLLTLSDYSRLYIAGQAFEQDANQLHELLNKGWPISADFESQGTNSRTVKNLTLLFVSDAVDPLARTLPFFVELPNQRVRDAIVDGHRFVNWQYKPGQRATLHVPVEEWTNRLVLPVDGVVRDGAETYVFSADGDHFHAHSVRVDYRDNSVVVIAPSNELPLGTEVVISAAQQLYVALRNQSSGGTADHDHDH